MTQFIAGIDVGGSKVDVQLFTVTGGALAVTPEWSTQEETQRGLEAHTLQIVRLINLARLQAQAHHGELVRAGIASPGRFDAQGVIKAGTNTNMGATPSEFDGICLRDHYMKALGDLARVPVYVANDADAMLLDMIEAMIVNGYGDKLYGHQVALLGIGTGVGHAIAYFSKDSHLTFHTDGHASKLRVRVDAADWPYIAKLTSMPDAPHIVVCEDGSVRAEDLFRAPVVNALAGVTSGQHIESRRPEHSAALAFAGKYMARLIALIASGESQDVNPENSWSDADRAQAAKTDMYLIGGGMGASSVGAEIVYYAHQELKKLGLERIRLLHYSGHSSPARAAALLTLQAAYRRNTG